MYEYISHVLSNYFSSCIGHSEEEATSILREHIDNSKELAEGLRADLERALLDMDYSWKDAFADNDVLDFGDEEQARTYARRLLWDPLFEE